MLNLEEFDENNINLEVYNNIELLFISTIVKYKENTKKILKELLKRYEKFDNSINENNKNEKIEEFANALSNCIKIIKDNSNTLSFWNDNDKQKIYKRAMTELKNYIKMFEYNK